MTADPKRVQSLFLEAVELPPEQRPTLLEQACREDSDLRRRVEALLHAHDHPGSALASGIDLMDESAIPLPEETVEFRWRIQEGAVIADRYTLTQKLGEGGMGEVWVAKQSEPIKRRVALKLIKAGMDSRAVLARFEQERQALAMMDHPHIARVLDGGMTPGGQPFFVMELVNGLPLTKFCDEARLTLQQRLELFIPICQAVQHAHQKGIVHRDLKPANILVTIIDGKPVPKVIDFGVAKATGGKLTEDSLSTQFGAVVGTLEYMAPEQAGFSGADIDTRADIYSLGVILYELLTGLRPIDGKRLREAAVVEMIRMIREEEPSKPSLRLSTNESLPSLAAVRQTEPKKLMTLLRGELDWVVMKCLEKQRDRRYETASDLSRDIRRYLSDQPVEAKPLSLKYRAGKFLKRNKGPVLAAALVLLVLLCGIIGTTYGLIEAKKQEEIALQEAEQKELARQAEAERAEGERLAKQEAQQQRNQAETAAAEATAAQELAQQQKINAEQSAREANTAREQAQQRLDQMEKAYDILSLVFEKLDPGAIALDSRPLQAILVEQLDEAVGQLEVESIDDPLMVAKLQYRLAISLLALGEPEQAASLLKKAHQTLEQHLGKDHPDTLTSLNDLALAYQRMRKVEQAQSVIEETLERRKQVLGPHHRETLTTMSNRALNLEKSGKMDEAITLYEETLELMRTHLGPQDSYTMIVMHNLGSIYRKRGRLPEAVELLKETVALMEVEFGPNHLNTLSAQSHLASAYENNDELEKAIPLFERVFEFRKTLLGPTHPDTLTSMNNLALAYQDTGRLEDALPLLEGSFQLSKLLLGQNHPDTLTTMSNLAVVYLELELSKLALPLFEETLKLRRAIHPEDSEPVLSSMSNLAEAHLELKQYDQALLLFEDLLPLQRTRYGSESAEVAYTLNQIAEIFIRQRQLEKAEPFARESLAIRKKIGPKDWKFYSTQATLGGILLFQGKYEEAEPLLTKACLEMRRLDQSIPPKEWKQLTVAIQMMIRLYQELDQPFKKQTWEAELEAWEARMKKLEESRQKKSPQEETTQQNNLKEETTQGTSE